MTVPVPLPGPGSVAWYPWAQDMHDRSKINLTGIARAIKGPVRLVALGDSLTAGDNFVRYLALLAAGRVRVVKNSGVGGNQITDMITRFDTDVTPFQPTMVSVWGGTNDYTNGATDAQFRQRIRDFVSKCRDIGAGPLLYTSPPCNVLADPDRSKIPRNNVWMVEYANREGIALVDAYGTLVDPVGFGNYKSIYDSGDGIHPNDAGHYAVALEALEVLTPILPPVTALAWTDTDPTNLVVNGFLKDPNADTWPDSWSQNWGLSAGTWAYTQVADALVPGGTVFRMTFTTATGKAQQHQAITTGFSVGDQIRVTAFVTTSAGMNARIHATTQAGATFIADYNQQANRVTTRGLIDIGFTVPATCDTIDITIVGEAQAAGTTGTADFGAVTVRNETVLGLVNPYA